MSGRNLHRWLVELSSSCRIRPAWYRVVDNVSWSDKPAFHNILVVGSSPTSSTTQSRTLPSVVVPASDRPPDPNHPPRGMTREQSGAGHHEYAKPAPAYEVRYARSALATHFRLPS